MKRKIQHELIEEFYERACECLDLHQYSVLKECFCLQNNISKPYLDILLKQYAKKTKKKSVREVIEKRNIKNLLSIISKNPTNLQQCFRDYVSKFYPDINKETKKYISKVRMMSDLWYHKASVNSTCFMIVSKKGFVGLNRKNSSIEHNKVSEEGMKRAKIPIKDAFATL